MDYSFGTWIKRRRKALDITQQELAQKVGCSVSAVIKIEADERRPSRQIAELLAKHLEIPPDQTTTFIKVARQEKTVELLDALPHFSASQTFNQRIVPTPEKPVSVSSPLKADLPVPPTPLIGRERELKTVIQQLNDHHCRLLTLTGPGGVGKTRLALEIAHQLQEVFENGVYFIELAGVNSPDFIVYAIANKLGLVSSGSDDPRDQLSNFLHGKQMLLVLDNLEHLQKGVGLLGELLERTEKIKLLTTSRESLNLRAEWVFGVQGLPLPHDPLATEIETSSAVKFFVRCAKQAHVDFELKDEERSSVLRICQLVEGFPLGIELAATWVRVLSCAEIAQEIERSINFLSTTVRDVPERHRSMEAVFNHSWDLLANDEQKVFMKLSIFRGGFTRRAAEQVSGATLPLLSALTDKSLLYRAVGERYDLHDLLRQYARERLLASGDFDHTSNQHLKYFLEFVEQAESNLQGGKQLYWLNRLERDHDNLRAALEWSLRPVETLDEKTRGQEEQIAQESLKLSGKLYLFWKRRDHWGEGRKWLQRSLSQVKGLPASPEYARALNAAVLLAVEQADTNTAQRLSEENLSVSRKLGNRHCLASALGSKGLVLWKQKDFATARDSCEEGLAIFRELGDEFAVADALHFLGHIAINQNEYEAARSYLQESLDISQGLQNQIGVTEVLGDLGLLAYLQKDHSAAYKYLEESLAGFREAGSLPGIESALNRLGDLARYQGDYEQAGKLYSESLALYRNMNDMDEIPSLLHNLGYVAQHHGDNAQALALFKEGLAIQLKMGNQAGIAECLVGIAGALVALGYPEEGARLFGAAEVLFETLNLVFWPANRLEYDRNLGLLRESVDESVLLAAWEAGRAMSVEQAVLQTDRY
jgi:predicted ATPase/transcriptional regulator with XRE-family HTH domain